ncbi:multicopper oxidase domain-containing protein [uncultured Arthrobacter sp.]|uniref:multicopper oxidase domain-containing protein n=1 Tax=uncultured Arthrobacter sp. TaxID=114050 RepID=UPI0032173A93
MGERIDALLTVREWYTLVLALPEGKLGQALGFISTGTGKQPLPAVLSNESGGTVVEGGQLKADPAVAPTVIFDADNPGQCLAHCHNAYHAERGMMALFSYIK